MYIIVRIIIGLIILGLWGCATAVLKKSKAAHKHFLKLILQGLLTAASATLIFVPFENLFVTFDSPKAAYEYSSFGKTNIALIVEGTNCDFIVDHENGSETYLIIPKTADGWKMGKDLYTRRIRRKKSNGISVYVYQHKNTSDYFITVFDANGEELTVSDEYNTKFLSSAKNDDSSPKPFVTYYAHTTNFTSDYSVIVNGNKIVLKK